jgi:hypothetical protein
MAKKYTKTDLEAVAVEFNVFLEEDTKIEVGDKVTKEMLISDIKDIVENILEPGDKVSDETIKTLGYLGIDLKEKWEEPAVEEKAPTKEEKAPTKEEKVSPKKETITKMDVPPVKEKTKKTFVANPEIGKRNLFIEGLIAEGKYTAKEIVDKAVAEFPGQNKSGISTVVSDSKNPKYNKFSKLSKMDPETKILSN